MSTKSTPKLFSPLVSPANLQSRATPKSMPKSTPRATPKSVSKSTPRPPSSNRKRKRPDPHQTVLDAGQSKIGLEHCEECGMTYNVDQENDVQMHTDYHNRFNSTKPFQVRTAQVEQWKRLAQHIKLTNPFPATIFVFSQDTKCFSLKRKLDEIVEEYVNVELGFCDDVPIWKENRVALVLLVDMEQGPKTSQLIAGVALIDPIDTVIIQPDEKQSKRGKYAGINRLWIQQSMRRKSLGTLLTNVARSVLYPDVPKDGTRSAFYQPTEESMPFVMAYFNNQQRYLVYREEDD